MLYRKEERSEANRCFFACSSLVYVEADTSLRQYEDAEGKKNTQLSLVQRECPIKTSSGKTKKKLTE